MPPEQAERTFRVHVHQEAGSLWAEVLELPGCFATGDTEDELAESLREAIALYLDLDPTPVRGDWADRVDPVEERNLILC